MPIQVDLSALWREVRKISNEESGFSLAGSSTFEEIDLQLEQGIEIVIDDVDFTGPVASYLGRQILLYIPDHGSQAQDVIAGRSEGNRFHVTDCKTLESMRRQNRFARYFATNDLSGFFSVHGNSDWGRYRTEGKANLKVCRNCMNRLNYKGYKTEVSDKDSFIKNFSIAEFFETFSSLFRTMPKAFKVTDSGNYTQDWPEISAQLKQAKNYTCEECQVCLVTARSLCQVHHVNGVKSDNSRANLRVLCVDCHRRQPKHGHIHVSRKDMQLINRLRRKSRTKQNTWDEALKLADPAIFGALCHLRRSYYPAPEIGYELQNDRNEVVAQLEAAWPARKYALVVNDSEIPAAATKGWAIVTLAQYHEDHL